jgi:hypothetical protein
MDSETRQRPSGKNDSNIDQEVQKLFTKGGKVTQNELTNLRYKYNNEDLVDKIQKKYIEKHNEITKRAKKFAQLIREKYSDSQYPFHILLEKAFKYKHKYGLSNEEFGEFQRVFENTLVGNKSPDVYVPMTNITKVLGDITYNIDGFTQKLSDNDSKILNDIIKLNRDTRVLHSQVKRQSLVYKDCAIEALAGQYNRLHNNVSDHVHPVCAALFFPKIDILEDHFIHSNISNIVKTRHSKEPFSTLQDAKLFDALRRDPNDVVCDGRSTLLDLYNRAQLQVQLWNSVLHLRNGQYYNVKFADFINSIDVCKMNKYDSPDLVYGRYDATIMKRLLAAFSFRPTVITTVPNIPNNAMNPYQYNTTQVINYVPMINLRLPLSVNDNTPIALEDSLEQVQIINENGVLVTRQTNFMYSNGVLIFYVDRRSNIIETSKQITFGMRLPTATAGYERLNKRRVTYKYRLQFKNDVYVLRSVVVSDTSDIDEKDNLIIGSSTIITTEQTSALERERPSDAIKYDPYGVIKSTVHNASYNKYNDVSIPTPIAMQEAVNPRTISQIPYTYSDDGAVSFEDMAQCNGIIFVYQLKEDKSKGEIMA